MGALALAATLAAIPSVALGLASRSGWVNAHDLSRPTLGAITAGGAASRVPARVGVSTTMVAAIVPLLAVFGNIARRRGLLRGRHG